MLLVDPSTGATKLLHEDSDSSWLEWIPGLPAFAADGDLLVYQDHIASDTRRVCKVNTAACSRTFVTPVGVQVRSILSHNAAGLIFSAVLDSPCVSLHHAAWDGQTVPLLNTDDGGHHLAQCVSSADPDSAVIVVASSALTSCETQYRVIVKQRECGHIANNQISPALCSPPVIPNPILLKLTPASLATVLLFPKTHVRGSCRLPLIMCPYGGPHHAKAIANGRSHVLAQYAPRCQPALACNPPHIPAGTLLTLGLPSPSLTVAAPRAEDPFGTAACTTISRHLRLKTRRPPWLRWPLSTRKTLTPAESASSVGPSAATSLLWLFSKCPMCFTPRSLGRQ